MNPIAEMTVNGEEALILLVILAIVLVLFGRR